jgi:hypothetical protein
VTSACWYRVAVENAFQRFFGDLARCKRGPNSLLPGVAIEVFDSGANQHNVLTRFLAVEQLSEGW